MAQAAPLIALLIGTGLVHAVLGIRQYRNYVLHRDTPTGQIQSAPIGRVKLTGTVKVATEPLGFPFRDTPFVYAEWELIPRRDDNEVRLHDDLMESGESVGPEAVPFYLEDDSGQVLVADPLRATVVTDDVYPSTTERLVAALVEAVFGVSDDSKQIAVGDEITVFGQLVPCRDPPGQVEDADRLLEREETTGRFLISTGEQFDIATRYRREMVRLLASGLLLCAACLALWIGDGLPL